MTEHAERTGAPEREVASDLVRRGLLVAPLLAVVAGAWRGWDGAISALLAVALVLVNFVIAAGGLAWASRISASALVAAVFAGYALRLGLVTVAFVVLRDRSWADIWSFGLVLLVTHVGLLVWETRYVSLSLAAPGLRPGSLPMKEE